MRIILFIVFFCIFISMTPSSNELFGKTSTRTEPALRLSTNPTGIVSAKLDFKKQELPKQTPGDVRLNTCPNLDPLIEQLIRHAELESSATKIMAWVYTTTSETVVADYEEAVKRLDYADLYLQDTMRRLLYENNSIESDPGLAQAIFELDNAEFTIMLLVEIAKLEL